MSTEDVWKVGRVINYFGRGLTRDALLHAEKSGRIPPAKRNSDRAASRYWTIDQIPAIGREFGFMRSPERPLALTVFSAKGGTYKSTLTLNLGRTYALHGYKTCLIGLDYQCDLTLALGLGETYEEVDTLEELRNMKSDPGLAEYQERLGTPQALSLNDLLLDTDIPTLKVIPEEPNLAALTARLNNTTRREYFLSDYVIKELKNEFDIILIDCNPSWDILVSNALAACDVLITPLETSVMQFRNVDGFLQMIDGYRHAMNVALPHLFVPTRFNRSRKLAQQILTYYRTDMPSVGVTQDGLIRDNVTGEESVANGVSTLEYAPKKEAAHDMRNLCTELSELIADVTKAAAAA